MRRLVIGLFLIGGLFGQTTTTTATCPAGVPNTPYSYFGSTGIGYDQFAKLPSIATGFGVKTGTCSNGFLVTTISTGIGSNNANPGYGMLFERYEYHIAHSSLFEFIGDGQLGVVQTTTSATNTVTTATFGGGAAVAFDIGWWLSKGKFHIPVVFHVDYVTAPAISSNAVKPSYLLDFRKTF